MYYGDIYRNFLGSNLRISLWSLAGKENVIMINFTFPQTETLMDTVIRLETLQTRPSAVQEPEQKVSLTVLILYKAGMSWSCERMCFQGFNLDMIRHTSLGWRYNDEIEKCNILTDLLTELTQLKTCLFHAATGQLTRTFGFYDCALRSYGQTMERTFITNVIDSATLGGCGSIYSFVPCH